MAKKKVTALAKRPKKVAGLRPAKRKTTREAHAEVALREDLQVAASLAHTLGEEIAIADFGLVEVKFTAAEEAVLSRAPRIEDLRVKPTGAVYLPHPSYTRWLNEAFGRTGWALRPASKPLLNGSTVVIPYLLMVHGKPVAFALGEQEFIESNKDQSYGDALESTVASGLRRTCKHLGLGLELWDKSFNDAFLAEHCVQAWQEGKNRPQWRRRIDPPFWWEKREGEAHKKREERRPPAQEVPPVAHHGKADEPITPEQRTRFYTIARRRGRSDEEIKAYLHSRGYSSSKSIRRRDYESICTAVEHPGALPGTIIDIEREPGAEG